MSISQLILTNINISKDILDNDIHKIQNGIFFVVIINMNVDRAVFIRFYDDFIITQTLNKRNCE